MDSFIDTISGAFDWATAASVILALVALVAGAWTSLKGLRVGSIEIDPVGVPRVVLTRKGDSAAGAGGPPDPAAAPTAKEPEAFEVKALATYYNRALSRATISFWFSIIFATIGFGVIIFALLSHDSSDLYATILKVVSGTVIDAVSSLFFFQSTNAQKQMGDFFEKLRLDRLISDARAMIGEVENAERRDQLRAQLVLKFAGIEQLLEGGAPGHSPSP
jgi:hypothetical protein